MPSNRVILSVKDVERLMAIVGSIPDSEIDRYKDPKVRAEMRRYKAIVSPIFDGPHTLTIVP